jgi:hypothetical protein
MIIEGTYIGALVTACAAFVFWWSLKLARRYRRMRFWLCCVLSVVFGGIMAATTALYTTLMSDENVARAFQQRDPNQWKEYGIKDIERFREFHRANSNSQILTMALVSGFFIVLTAALTWEGAKKMRTKAG